MTCRGHARQGVRPTDRPGRPTRLTLLGPAFIAAVAYVVPGNVATNVTAGARYGFTLGWVVVLASLMALLIQYLSAKLGLVTHRSLFAQLHGRLSRPVRVAYWLQAEVVAIATDLAEVVGGAIALHLLLFGLPLVLGAVITGLVAIDALIVVLTCAGVADPRGVTVRGPDALDGSNYAGE